MEKHDEAAIKAIGLGPDNAGPTNPATFNPDWDQLEACRDSLREHMQLCLKYRATIEGLLKMAMKEAETSRAWKKAVRLTQEILAEDLLGTAGQESPADNAGEMICENTASQKPEHAGIDAVSPAISQALSPSTDENYKTESDGNKSCNKSGSQSSNIPKCYGCKWRGSLVGDCHSECRNPNISESDRLLSPLFINSGLRSGTMKKLNITYSTHGVKMGWFMWPLNFDPVWLKSCDGYEMADATLAERAKK